MDCNWQIRKRNNFRAPWRQLKLNFSRVNRMSFDHRKRWASMLLKTLESVPLIWKIHTKLLFQEHFRSWRKSKLIRLKIINKAKQWLILKQDYKMEETLKQKIRDWQPYKWTVEYNSDTRILNLTRRDQLVILITRRFRQLRTLANEKQCQR